MLYWKGEVSGGGSEAVFEALERFGKLFGPTSIELGELFLGVFEAHRFGQAFVLIGDHQTHARETSSGELLGSDSQQRIVE